MRSKFALTVLLLTVFTLAAEEIKTINLDQYIRSRYKAGVREIVLPDGKVKCHTATLGKEFKDLTIRGGKNTMLISDRLGPLFFLNGCKNVTLKDFSVDYDPLPFTQGTVTKIDRTKNCITFKLHKGYPRLKKPYLIKHHPLYFESTSRNLKYGKHPCGLVKVERISDDEGVVYYNNNKFEIKPGDFIVLNVRWDGVFKVRGMTDTLTYRNITIYSGMAGIFARRVKARYNTKTIQLYIPDKMTDPGLWEGKSYYVTGNLYALSMLPEYYIADKAGKWQDSSRRFCRSSYNVPVQVHSPVYYYIHAFSYPCLSTFKLPKAFILPKAHTAT